MSTEKNMDYYEHLFEAADQVVNPDGYADDSDESDARGELRDRIYAALCAVIQPHLPRR